MADSMLRTKGNVLTALIYKKDGSVHVVRELQPKFIIRIIIFNIQVASIRAIVDSAGFVFNLLRSSS